jgi:hypothetical protein
MPSGSKYPVGSAYSVMAGDGTGVGLVEVVGLGVGVGVCDGVGVGVGVAECVGVGDGPGEMDGDAIGVGDTDATAVGVAVGAGRVTAAVPPEPLHAARSEPRTSIAATGANEIRDSERIDPLTTLLTTSSPFFKGAKTTADPQGPRIGFTVPS